MLASKQTNALREATRSTQISAGERLGGQRAQRLGRPELADRLPGPARASSMSRHRYADHRGVLEGLDDPGRLLRNVHEVACAHRDGVAFLAHS